MKENKREKENTEISHKNIWKDREIQKMEEREENDRFIALKRSNRRKRETKKQRDREKKREWKAKIERERETANLLASHLDVQHLVVEGNICMYIKERKRERYRQTERDTDRQTDKERE